MLFDLGVANDFTDLSSPVISTGTNHYCLRFWYWRHNTEPNNLAVLVFKKSAHPQMPGTVETAWSANHTFPRHMWHRAMTDVDLGQIYHISIRANQILDKQSKYSFIYSQKRL